MGFKTKALVDSYQAILRNEIVRYSACNGYKATYFADAFCVCGESSFALHIDDNEGCAVRVCTQCGSDHFIGDSEDFVDEAELWQAVCTCRHEHFTVMVGVSLYEGSNDVRWLYLACRCRKCGLVGVYGDWKNEYCGYEKLLALV